MEDFECIELSHPYKDVSVVRLVDDRIMDLGRINQLGEELFGAVDKQTGKLVLINFENVKFLSSNAISKLVVLEKRVRSAGKKLKLSNLRPEVQEIFNITNLNQRFDLCDDQDEVLKSFENGE